MLVDTHCHLTHGRFAADLSLVIAEAREQGVPSLLTIGTGLADARAALAIADAFPGVSASAGLDPFSCHEAGSRLEADFAGLETLLAAGRYLAVGEFGLEYHHSGNVPGRAEQREHCLRQLALACRLDLPAILHVREAHEDMLELLALAPSLRGVVHSFSGDSAIARRYLDRGLYLSFNGMLTYKGNDALRAAAALVNADRLLLETDAPYLAPMPQRGRRCTPAMVRITATALAELRAERLEDLAAWTTRNAQALFALPPLAPTPAQET